MGEHALLGPSGAKRWMTCTPSARFEEQFEEVESEYAAEGSAAHELADMLIQVAQMGLDFKHIKEFAESNKYFDKEMEEAVDSYAGLVLNRFNEAKAKDPGAILLPEQKLDYSLYVPGGFGTGDATIISNGFMEVIDLKYGKGVAVYAENNPQLKLYALGAYIMYSSIYDIEQIRMTICQPRLDSITSDIISVKDLLRWVEKEVVPAANLAWAGHGDFVSGDHCQFCKGAPRCPQLAADNLEMAKHDFVLPGKLSDAEIADILGKTEKLTKWAKAVGEYALSQALHKGVKWPGYKLVEGRSIRKITDQIKAAEILKGVVEEPLIYKPKQLLALGELEKLVGKKKLNEILEKVIEKPSGKPTLVLESDKRPELSSTASAARDFKN